jgi:hypothetical protein
MISAKDRWIILNNIIANSGGIDKVDLTSEFAKAIAGVNKFNAQQQMAQMTPPQPPQGTMSGQPVQSMPQDPNAVNQPNPMDNGQGAMNVPQM